jgi:alpha-L-rhamnosidase
LTTLVAQWIWRTGEAAPPNVHMQFRRTFMLAAEAAEARLHISADSRYLLMINGARIGYGPARNYHFHYEYDSYDLRPLLKPGEHVIAVDVSHWGEGTFHQMVGRGGLLAQLDLDGQPRLWTDASWRVERSAALRQNTPRIACQAPWEEQVDARLEDVGWTAAGFDDSAWEPALVIGPAGVAPWGELSPRSIPFLTDEPLTPVRARALGRARRPEVVAAIHAGPYLAPGDLSANRHVVDALIATTLIVPMAGKVTFKRCSIAGGDAPHVLIGGRQVLWQGDPSDVSAEVALEAGDHAVLIDWNGKTHDMDITLTASGMDGLAVSSPLAGETGTWAIACAPGAARAAARQAASPEALLRCGIVWQPVRALNTPVADVTMDITASVVALADKPEAHLPLRITPAPAGQAQHYLIDFGRLLIGWIEFEVEAAAGTTLDLLGYEGVQDGRPQMTAWMNNSLRYVCREGRQTYRSALRRGLRYLIVAVHGAASETVLHNVSPRLSTYPWNIQGAFRCSDPRLNQIWELCAYTLRLCSEDTFTDCPTYEQTLWTGDACSADIPVHLAVHGDPRLPRRVLLLVADSLRRLPIAGAQVPGDWENDMLPNWSFLWAMGCAEFYFHTGDTEFARLVYPALAKQAAFIEAARNDAGLVALPGFWHLLDWAKIPDGANEILAHESCLAAGAFNATATLARAAGQAEAAEHWQSVGAELAAAVNRECWRNDVRAYGDLWRPEGVAGPAFVTAAYGMTMAAADCVSQPTNIAALLGGVATGERAEAILPNLLNCPPGWVPTGTPWIHSLGGEQLARRGHLAPVLDTIRDRWGDMLDKGATTAWELFSGFEGMQGWWTRSWCHAWSAYPAFLLPAYALGVRPLEPGFARALIAPQLCDLTWAEGRVPTPHGPIAVRVEQGEAGWITQVTLPEGVAGEVHVPAGRVAAPRVTGAAAKIERAGAEFVVHLPAGATATIVAAAAIAAAA